ncbi:MAG: tetratricopeptide repeat protein [Planctomycetota bacterium]|nr:tetratricopeptide repeat protein [Planctomycetota bacterium]
MVVSQNIAPEKSAGVDDDWNETQGATVIDREPSILETDDSGTDLFDSDSLTDSEPTGFSAIDSGQTMLEIGEDGLSSSGEPGDFTSLATMIVNPEHQDLIDQAQSIGLLDESQRDLLESRFEQSPGCSLEEALSILQIDENQREAIRNLNAQAKPDTGQWERASTHLSKEQRQDLLVLKTLLDRGQVDLTQVNQILSQLVEGKSKLLDLLQLQGVLDKQNSQTLHEEMATISPDLATKSFADLMGRYTVVTTGNKITLHDKANIQLFGPYEVLDEIARGGMGVVYKAQHTVLGRVVALKVMLAGDTAHPEEMARFQRETQATAHLDHPNIVRIYDVGQQGETPYFTMELVRGCSLEAMIRDDRPGVSKAIDIINQLAQGLAYSHAEGIIHRDLKPANILFDEEGIPKLTDFGLAKFVESETNLTRSGATLGTPAYMSPEQAAGDGDRLGPLSDVYSMGVIFYEILTGEKPHKGRSFADLVVQILNKEPPRPRSLNPSIHPDVETICLKAMAKEMDRRYESSQAFAEDLERFRDGRAIEARAPGAVYRFSLWVRRNKVLATVIALAILAVVSVGGVFGAKAIQETRRRRSLEEAQARSALEKAQAFERREKSQVFFDKALLYQRRGRAELAVDFFRRAAQADPTYDQAFHESALVLKAMGPSRYPEAIQELDKANRAAPHKTSHLLERASIHQRQDDYKKSLKDLNRVLQISPEDPEALTNRASVWLAMGDTSNGLKDLESALSQRPDLPQALYNRGEIRRSQSNPSAALADYTRALEIEPGFYAARYAQARTYFELENQELARRAVDRAIEDVQKILQRSPSRRAQEIFDKSLLLRSTIRAEAGKIAQALSDLDKILAFDANRLDALRKRSTLFEAWGRLDDAIRDRRHILGLLKENDTTDRIELARLLLARDLNDEAASILADLPNSISSQPFVIVLKGQLAEARGQLSESLEFFDQIPADSKFYEQAVVSRARISLKMGRLEDAATLYAPLLKSAKGNPELLLNMILVRLESGKIEDALPSLKRLEFNHNDWLKARLTAVLRSPDKRQSYQPNTLLFLTERMALLYPKDSNVLAACLATCVHLASTNSADAQKRLEKATADLAALEPDHPLVLRVQATLAYQSDRGQEAITLLDRALTAAPQTVELYFLRAHQKHRLGLTLDALGDLGTLLNLQPGHIEGTYLLGSIYQEMEAFAQADQILTQLIASHPEHAGAYLQRALCRARSGDEDAALLDLNETIRLDDNADARFNRAVLHLRASRREAGVEDLRAALRLDPTHTQAKKILESYE